MSVNPSSSCSPRKVSSRFFDPTGTVRACSAVSQANSKEIDRMIEAYDACQNLARFRAKSGGSSSGAFAR